VGSTSIHRAHVFAGRCTGAADDAVGVFSELAWQGAEGIELTPLAAEVGVLECVVTAQAAKQHGTAGLETDGV